MLHGRDNDLVSGLYIFSSPGISHEVDTFSSAPGKNYFFTGSCVDELFYGITGILKRRRGFFGKRMNAAVNVGVLRIVIIYSASITTCGFCEVAALSRYTSGLSFTILPSTGNCSRMAYTSRVSDMVADSVIIINQFVNVLKSIYLHTNG